MKVLLIAANREMLPQPVVPLGVLSIAGAIRDTHDVEVLDLCFESSPHEATRNTLERFVPDVVGIGIRNLHSNAYDATDHLIETYAELVAWVRQYAPNACVVLGGSGYSLQPIALLDRLGADFGVVGEGEEIFPKLLAQITHSRVTPAVGFRTGDAPESHPDSKPESIARIVYAEAVQPRSLVTLTRGDAKQIRSRTERHVLDHLPQPARDLSDPRYFTFDGTGNVQSKRGCAFECTYCDYPDLEGRRVRLRSPGLVADEMIELGKTASHIFIVDSVFNIPRSHATAICDELIAKKSSTPWVCYVSPVGLDDALIEKMALAGCIGAEIGTDSGSDKMLERLKKPFRLEQVRAVHRGFQQFGLFDCHTFVLGAEHETPEEARETLQFVADLDPDVAVFIVFMEDRENMSPRRAEHRDALLAILREEAPRRPGWVVPELSIRFGEKISRLVRRANLRGPAWVHLARERRRLRDV